jgi:NAD+ synthase (glutamine-hydrolysing)
MKIALAQVNVHIGNFAANVAKFKSLIEEAKLQGADLIVFPELGICGYPARDFLEYDSFIQQCQLHIESLATVCNGIACIIGSPSFNTDEQGKNLFNSAFVLEKGTIAKVVHKTLLPTYDIFDEYRYFEPNRHFECVEIAGVKVAITICEDLWNIGTEALYQECPMDKLILDGPDLMVNIAASPFDYAQKKNRLQVLKANVMRYQVPLVYVNHVGAQTELIFDGASLVLDKQGQIIDELDSFKEEMKVVDISSKGNPPLISGREEIEDIYNALILGVRDYFQKSNFKSAVIGLSGGIDSAVVAALATEALGQENVHGVLMPSQYSSDHSITDAKALALNLGIHHELIPIEEIYKSFELQLQSAFAGKGPDLTEENLQARIRGVLLMAVSNKHGHILLNTSNKSEAAVGYGTLYGDMCGGLSVIGDVYKTKVYELAHFINRDRELIPFNTISKAPSAELRHDQKDSDSLPEYGILDQILELYIEHCTSRDELIAKGFEVALIDRITGLVNRNEYKRYQTPPILRISPKAFGMGRRMPIVAKY